MKLLEWVALGVLLWAFANILIFGFFAGARRLRERDEYRWAPRWRHPS